MSRKESSLSFSSSSPLYTPFHYKAFQIKLQPKKYQISKPSKETFEARYVPPFIVDVEIYRTLQRASNASDNFCQNFGIELKVEKKTEFTGLAVGVILHMPRASNGWSKGLIIGDIITAVNNQKIHSGMETYEFNKSSFTSAFSVKLSLYVATPFRLLEDNNITFINNIISCSRRHRITVVRRPSPYTSEPQYGIRVKEKIVKFNNSSLMMVLVLSANEITTTGNAALYVGDIIISVNGIDMQVPDNDRFNSVLRQLSYPRNLYIEFIPTSCFRKFNLVEDMLSVTERIRPPLHVQQTQMDALQAEYYRLHSRRSRSFSSTSESEVTDDSQNDAGEYPGAAAHSSLQRSSSFSAFSAPQSHNIATQQFGDDETISQMQDLSLSYENNAQLQPVSPYGILQNPQSYSQPARLSHHNQQPQIRQVGSSLQPSPQPQYQLRYPPIQVLSVSDKPHSTFQQYNTQLQPVTSPGMLQNQQSYSQPARPFQHQPQFQTTGLSSQSYPEPPYQLSFHQTYQQPSVRRNVSTTQLPTHADYSSPQYYRQPVASSPVHTISRRQQYQQTSRSTTSYNQPQTSYTYQQPAFLEYQDQQAAQYQPFVNQYANQPYYASQPNVGTSSYTNDRQRFQEMNDPQSFYRSRGQRGRYSRRH